MHPAGTYHSSLAKLLHVTCRHFFCVLTFFAQESYHISIVLIVLLFAMICRAC